MPLSNPSLEEMCDSHSGPKHLGQAGTLSTLCYIRPRSVVNPVLWPLGPVCWSGASGYFIMCAPEQSQHRERGMAERPPASPQALATLHLFLADHSLL